jgi:hypothetical protein
MLNADPTGGRPRLVPALGIAIGLTLLPFVLPSTGTAQGFFPFFFGDFFGGPREARPPAPSFAEPPIRHRHTEATPTPHRRHVAEAREEHDDDAPSERRHGRHASSSGSSSRTAVCVRLCDGRYFPLPPATTDDANVICAAACPKAATAVFRGDGDLKDTTDAGGNAYGALPNAFAYRSRLVPDCTCKDGKLGMASIAIDKDPTLEQGDIVVMQQGPLVSRGKSGDERHIAFTPVKNYSDIDPDVRRYLATLRLKADR